MTNIPLTIDAVCGFYLTTVSINTIEVFFCTKKLAIQTLNK